MVETSNNEISFDNEVSGNRENTAVEPESVRMNVEKRNACGNVEPLKSAHAGVMGAVPSCVSMYEARVPVHEAMAGRLVAMGDEAKARHLMRFFKTGPGQYGEGDRFLGVTVPGVRSIVREYRRVVTEDDVMALTASPWHEVRLAGFLSLIEIYERLCRRHSESGARAVVEMYLSLIDRGNNWDLVDLVAPKILGHRLVEHPAERHLLGRLAAMDGHLWHQRVAIVATWALIRAGEYDDTLSLARALLRHPHDLIHKAVGWMLREVGKRGGHDELRLFLDDNAAEMPRTMLRYAIERLDEPVRRHYMSLGRPK